MSRIWQRLAAIAAFGIGFMAVFAGAPVLLGRNPGWRVIGWVPYYNVVLGVVSVVVTAVLLWLGRPLGRILAVATLVLHTSVLIILLTIKRDTVAPDTVEAMTIRVVVWVVVVGLIIVQHFVDGRRNAAVGPTQDASR